MDNDLQLKLKGMLWDIPVSKREKLLRQILSDPGKAFSDKQLLIRGLNSLSWYDLILTLGSENLLLLLSDNIISNLYPRQRQLYYQNAKELLSKYTLSLTR
jgi:hypothetical protein